MAHRGRTVLLPRGTVRVKTERLAHIALDQPLSRLKAFLDERFITAHYSQATISPKDMKFEVP